ncbi:MAG TPA: hypothetical protein VF308_14115, partial [Caldimonas sp.]
MGASGARDAGRVAWLGVHAGERDAPAVYAILLIGPFLGWAAASAHSVPVKLLGVLALPSLAPRKAKWGFEAGDIHGYA